MSDTPRTDEENMELYDGHSYLARIVEAVPVEFVRNLERESDQLAKQCVCNVEEIGQLRAELAFAKNAVLEIREWTPEQWDRICAIQKPNAIWISGDQMDCFMAKEGTDAARLDWLVQFGHKGLVDLADQNIFITREAIDEAMEAQNDE